MASFPFRSIEKFSVFDCPILYSVGLPFPNSSYPDVDVLKASVWEHGLIDNPVV